MRTFFLLLGCLLSLIVSAQDPVRGVWLTNTGSKVLNSRQQIREAVMQCKDQGLSDLFMVVWNNGKTMFPSQVTWQYVGQLQDPVFAGRDPLQEMIEEAHAVGLRMHAWLEFGFSYSYKDSLSVWNKKYPTWAGRNAKGYLLQKNGFYWWNALHPGPQQFLKELVEEIVSRYDIDGIQGDDRLPAMPSEGGYEPETLAAYGNHGGDMRAAIDPKKEDWLQWRADKLSTFAQQLYQQVKATKPTCLVTWSPSIYPWSKQEYLQDWPTWLRDGYADYVFPQLYRYNAEAYEQLLKDLNAQLSADQKRKVFPGVLTSLGDGYQANRTLLNRFISLNRTYGYNGEVFFYYETLNRISGPLYSDDHK
ncbi:MAG: glycoside hydrolase family 10 protein [Bacteroidota bacterium]